MSAAEQRGELRLCIPSLPLCITSAAPKAPQSSHITPLRVLPELGTVPGCDKGEGYWAVGLWAACCCSQQIKSVPSVL